MLIILLFHAVLVIIMFLELEQTYGSEYKNWKHKDHLHMDLELLKLATGWFWTLGWL